MGCRLFGDGGGKKLMECRRGDCGDEPAGEEAGVGMGEWGEDASKLGPGGGIGRGEAVTIGRKAGGEPAFGAGEEEESGREILGPMRDDPDREDAVAAGPEVLLAGVVGFGGVDGGEVNGEDEARLELGRVV